MPDSSVTPGRPHAAGGPRATRGWLRPTLSGASWVLALTLASTSQADIYKSVGADGVISFSNTKSRGSQLYERSASRPVAMPRDSSPERYTRYDQYIREAATLYQIPEELIRAVIKVESDFDPRAVSPANAHGLMQLIPPTAERMMVTDIFDPRQNSAIGVEQFAYHPQGIDLCP